MLISTRILLFPFYLLIAAGLLLPSDGSHGLLSPKSLLFVLASSSVFLLALIRQKFHPSQLLHGVFLAFFLTFIIVWMLIGIENPMTKISSTVDQAKLFLITIAVPLMTLYLCKENLIDSRQILRVAILSNMTYCFVKLMLIAMHLVGAINMWELLNLTGIRIMEMGIVGGLHRLQTSVDISTPFFFMFVLFSEQLGLNFSPRIRRIYLFIAIISNFFTFSRYLLLIQAIAFGLYLFSLTPRKFLKTSLIASICLLLAIGLFGPQNFLNSVEKRFFSRSSYKSDQARVDQINALWEQTEKAPYFGSGLESHAPKAVRDQQILHSYEVQWAAFLMQLGIVGVAVLVIFLSLIALPFLAPPVTRPSLAFFSLYILWILSGFTNPFLISLQSGIIYSSFIAGAQALSLKK